MRPVIYIRGDLGERVEAMSDIFIKMLKDKETITKIYLNDE